MHPVAIISVSVNRPCPHGLVVEMKGMPRRLDGFAISWGGRLPLLASHLLDSILR